MTVYVFGLYFQIKSFLLFMDCVLKSPPPCHRLLSLVFPPIRCRREREGGFQTSVIYLHINFFNLPSSRVASCFVSEVNIDPKQKQRKMPSPRWKLQTASPPKIWPAQLWDGFFLLCLVYNANRIGIFVLLPSPIHKWCHREHYDRTWVR